MKSEKKSDNDTDIFQAAMAGVQPLKPDNRLQQYMKKPTAVPRQSRKDEASVKQELLKHDADLEGLETGEELLYLRPDYSPRLIRRLRRGQFSVADCIDLHQMSEKTAREVLLRFMTEAIYAGHGCVRVIHGKGLRSRGLPKLKIMTNNLLRKLPEVIAFASCRPVDGGTGAVNVLLKESKPRRR